MQSTTVIINLFGAIALLLFGLAQVKDGVVRAFGARLKAALAAGTKSGLRSFVSGLGATIALQSSTATALTVASFAERDMIRPKMAQIVLLGANVGTAITAWIVATGVEWLSPLIILAGVVFYRMRASARQGIGTALIGVGLMLLSLHLLGLATEPMRQSPALAAFIGLLDNAWPVALAVSAALAFVSSSSLAAIMLILSRSAAGTLSPSLAVVLTLGANLGGAIPPVLATSTASPAARRITLGNLVIRAAGCALALPLAGFAGDILAASPLPAASFPVDAHLAFNLALAILAWPLTGLVSTMMTNLIPAKSEAESAPRFLDAEELTTPPIALASAAREALSIGDTIERMLIRCENTFKHNDTAPLAEIAALEGRVDTIHQEVKVYLSQLGREGLNDEQSRRSIAIVDYVINLEHIGDIVEKGLCEQLRKKVANGLKFSDEGYEELRALFDLTIDNLRAAQTIFQTGDFNLARQLMEVKVEVRRLEKQSAERHFERLRGGRIDSLQTSSLHLDMLRDLKRINAHIVSVAHPILDDSGLLVESRLRYAEPKV